MSAVHRDATLSTGLQSWPAIERAFFRPRQHCVLDRRSGSGFTHIAVMPGKRYQWCVIVVGRPGGRLRAPYRMN